jgi:predicted deacylase
MPEQQYTIFEYNQGMATYPPLTYRQRVSLWLLVCALPLTALIGAWGGTTLPTAQAATVREFVLGSSAQGRPIEVVQFGDGPLKLVVVGATHGGAEANTYRLTLELIAHFRQNPDLVPPDVRIYFIPVLNPDGLALNWRFDGAGVDLNRNMNTNLDACPENDWSVTVFGAGGFISDTGGAFPDSQIETQLIRNFLLDAAGAIFIHSNAGLVFPAACEHAPSIAMAEAYAAGAGYIYSRFWPRYNITGGMHDWAGSMGIASVTPELVTGNLTEFNENVAGLLAVLEQREQTLPAPQDGLVEGISVPAPIFRYWRALGGYERFGPPLGPAVSSAEGISQRFRNVQLDLRYDLVDTPYAVQPAILGRQASTALAFGGAAAHTGREQVDGERFFSETGQSIRGAIGTFWERGGGLWVFGLPLSGEFAQRSATGEERVLQYFERAVLGYQPETGRVELLALGAWTTALEQLQAPAPQMIR